MVFRWLQKMLGGEGDRGDQGNRERGGERRRTTRDGWESRRGTKNRRARCDDPRLVPKPPRQWHEPVPKYLAPEVAKRLFSPSMATGRPELRRLGTDEAQLERYGLPVVDDEAELAKLLGVGVSRLQYFACHRLDDGVDHYVRFRIPKRSGGSRVIMAPKRELKALQREALARIVGKLPVSEYAHGFVRGRSIRTNAEPHRGKKLVLRFDLRDFFPSVTFFRVRGFLISLGYSYPVATSLALLMTACERHPVNLGGEVFYGPVGERYCVQGAPTSPALCNAIARGMDHRMAGLARGYGYSYTRYADDMTFSGDDDRAVGPLLSVVRQIAEDEGFSLNDEKTRVIHQGGHQRVTGVTVNEVVGLSRRERRKIRAMIHQMKRERTEGTLSAEKVRSLEGKLAYVEMLNPEQAVPLRRQWEES